jgi:general transcription factor 3C polypeptide 3 (transcription factor C subunit 4)
MGLVPRSDLSMSASDSATTDDDSQAAFESDRNELAEDRAGRKMPKIRSRHMRRRRSRAGPVPKGKKRGLRKPLEPSVEFKALHSQATMAFIGHDYEKAEKLALQAIHVNPEMFAAHSLLSEIHMARKDKPKALAALFNGAHTRPRDIQVWLKLAQWIIERAGNDEIASIRDAIYCYSRVIAVDKNNAKARHRRAALYRASGQTSRAALDYEHLLAHAPRDTTILRMLAEVYIDLNETDLALAHFERTFRYYRATELRNVTGITWSDINIYVEICGYEQEYQKGVFQLKSLARWLVGRANDNIWDSFNEDDREWDREDQPRRAQVQGFVSGQYKASAYGDGLPLELRTKLGLYRLKMGLNYRDEAIVSDKNSGLVIGRSIADPL